MYDFTINYPNADLKPTSQEGKFIGWRENNGTMQPIGVIVTQSAPYYDPETFTESVNIKVETIISDTFNPEIL